MACKFEAGAELQKQVPWGAELTHVVNSTYICMLNHRELELEALGGPIPLSVDLIFAVSSEVVRSWPPTGAAETSIINPRQARYSSDLGRLLSVPVVLFASENLKDVNPLP